MRREPPTVTPSQAFQNLTVIYFAFMAAVVIYFAVGEVYGATADDFSGKGFLDDSGMAWVVRGLLIVFAASQLIIIRTILSEDAIVSRVLAAKPDVDDAAAAGALQAAGIVTLQFVESIAIFGLVLYFLGGERYDLYGFGVVALVNFAFLRPSRERWEATFRRLATQYPGVRSSPW